MNMKSWNNYLDFAMGVIYIVAWVTLVYFYSGGAHVR